MMTLDELDAEYLRVSGLVKDGRVSNADAYAAVAEFKELDAPKDELAQWTRALGMQCEWRSPNHRPGG